MFLFKERAVCLKAFPPRRGSEGADSAIPFIKGRGKTFLFTDITKTLPFPAVVKKNGEKSPAFRSGILPVLTPDALI